MKISINKMEWDTKLVPVIKFAKDNRFEIHG